MSAPDIPPREARSDASPWTWLLLVPIVIPLLTFLYNAEEPRLLGFPLFYWLQLAFVLMSIAITAAVYQATKRRR
ncbi:MAG: DUF3311 domain-containing protein [Dehalococcoidia bacterium]